MTHKPRYGDPCNGCGACCQTSPCPLGRLVFGQEHGPCPAIEMDGEKTTCGLINTTVAYNLVGVITHGAEVVSQAAMVLTGSGVGCDTQGRGEIVHPDIPERFLNAALSIPRDVLTKAKAIWGIK
jgi:hypothetical protein